MMRRGSPGSRRISLPQRECCKGSSRHVRNLSLVTIIDLGISNIKSITRGFLFQGISVETTSFPEGIRRAESLVLPGVGAFPKAMEILNKRALIEPILDHVGQGRPLLGVCLGMQLLLTDSAEHELTKGLGIIPGHVVRFQEGIQVPHMGWNKVRQLKRSPLFSGIPDGADFYFVHSYIGQVQSSEDEIARTDHYGSFVSAAGRGRVYGVQFHPEKSQRLGLLLLRNFARFSKKED
jgi:glutamine amidotransferase